MTRGLLGTLLIAALSLGCGDDDGDTDTSTPDAFVAPDLGSDAGPPCGCRGERGTLLYDLQCGEGLCIEADLFRCIADGETQLDEGRCDDGDMGVSDGGT